MRQAAGGKGVSFRTVPRRAHPSGWHQRTIRSTLTVKTVMSAHQIYFHLAWTTRDRAPMIDAATRTFLDAFFRRTAAREHADIVALAILRTQVHLLIRTTPRMDLPRLVQFL